MVCIGVGIFSEYYIINCIVQWPDKYNQENNLPELVLDLEVCFCYILSPRNFQFLSMP